MRKIVAAAMLVALVGAAVGAGGWWFGRWFVAQGDAAAPELPKWAPAETPAPAPALAFTDLEGRPASLADFRGRVVLLNLWATWCAPCVEELPSLDRLQSRMGGPGFEVVALSLDRGGRAQVEPFLARIGVRALRPHLDPGSAAMAALRPRGLPTTYLIDREGRIAGRLEGTADWDSPAARRLIERHLGEGRPGVLRTGG
jgi:thiol-disulfide isomerase/thioredoxin